MFRSCVSLITTGALAFLAMGDIPVRAGGLLYPAIGNLDLEEGTIEVWFTPMTDLYPKLESEASRRAFTLFRLDVPEHFYMTCAWISRADGVHRLSISMGAYGAPHGKGNPMHGFIPSPAGWKPGQAHHVAFTWKGKEMAIFVDGAPAGTRQQAQGFTGNLAGTHICFGDPEEAAENRVILHAIRISSLARKDAELKTPQPTADLYTLLLDTFEKPNCLGEDGRTTAPVIAGLTGEKGGVVRGAVRYVEAPRPGLALYH